MLKLGSSVKAAFVIKRKEKKSMIDLMDFSFKTEIVRTKLKLNFALKIYQSCLN